MMTTIRHTEEEVEGVAEEGQEAEITPAAQVEGKVASVVIALISTSDKAQPRPMPEHSHQQPNKTDEPPQQSRSLLYWTKMRTKICMRLTPGTHAKSAGVPEGSISLWTTKTTILTYSILE